MPDFPTAVPDIPDAVAATPLSTLHGGTSQSTAMNRIHANLVALATKLGIIAGTPTTRQMLVGSATAGQSGWVDYADGATLVVAANDAPAASKSAAHYICDGVNDEVEIAAAITALPTWSGSGAGGTVRLTEGTFVIGASIITTRAYAQIVGAGIDATTLKVMDGAPSNTGLNSTSVFQVGTTCNNTTIRDLTIDGNKAANGSLTGMSLLWVRAYDCLVERVKFRNSPGNGPYFDTTGNHRIKNCVSENQASRGFTVLSSGATGVALIEQCIARNCSSYGYYFSGGVVQAVGCIAYANAIGFVVLATGSRLVACDASYNTSYGIMASAQYCEVVACQSYQNGNHGIEMSAVDTRVAYSTAYRNALHGIRGTSSQRGSIVGNRVSDNSTNTNAGFAGISLDSGTLQYAGQNMVRQGSAFANKQGYGLYVVGDNAGSSLVGLNDLHDSAVTKQFEMSVSPTTIRRTTKLLLDYTEAADKWNNNTSQPAATWLDCHPSQTFTVDSSASLITISVRAVILVRLSTDGPHMGTRLVVDGTPYPLGGGIYFSGKDYVNPFTGEGTITLENLAVGSHTVVAQVRWGSGTSTLFARYGSNPVYEFMNIQVREDLR